MFKQNSILLLVDFLFLPKCFYKECYKLLCHLHDFLGTTVYCDLGPTPGDKLMIFMPDPPLAFL